MVLYMNLCLAFEIFSLRYPCAYGQVLGEQRNSLFNLTTLGFAAFCSMVAVIQRIDTIHDHQLKP
jgi:hypothetical protein